MATAVKSYLVLFFLCCKLFWIGIIYPLLGFVVCKKNLLLGLFVSGFAC